MKKWLICLALALLLALCAGAALAEIANVPIVVTFGQTEARGMLEKINAFRTGGDAWYWNPDNTTKTVLTDLQPLEYDCELEKVAMQRAAEIAMSFSHTRPNSGGCFSAYSLAGISYSAKGENIAAGSGYFYSANSAFTGWQETDEMYGGQGHRRNMLSADFNRIGIGHVTFNGAQYWVQEFGRSTAAAAATAAAEDTRTVVVAVDTEWITDVALPKGVTGIDVVYGQQAELPGRVSMRMSGAFPSRNYDVELVPAWTFASTDVAAVSGTTLTGAKVGETSATATVLGRTLTLPVKVRPADLSAAAVVVNGSGFEYCAAPLTPTMGVTLNGMLLLPDQDYQVSYQDNVNAGTATATVTGVNNYTGAASATFAIAPAGLDKAGIAPLADVVYSGAAWQPEPVLTFQGGTLVRGVDYALSYADNVNAGTATVTATGAGNFTGAIQGTFQIGRADIAGLAAQPLPAQTYTGEELRPAPSLAMGVALTEGVDYLAAYSGNVNVGRARVDLTGLGNFEGAVTMEFDVVPADLSNAQVDAIPAMRFTGSPLTPAVRATMNGRELVEGVDYALSWRNNTDVTSSAAAVLSGIGNYAGAKERTFSIALPSEGQFQLADGVFRLKGGALAFVRPTASRATVVIPDTVKLGGKKLKVTEVADKAFFKDGRLTTLTLGKYVKTVGKSAFAYCGKLKTVKGGAALATIRDYAFRDCKALKAITLNKSVSKLGKGAFVNCKALKTLAVKTSKLTSGSVGAGAFKNISAKAVFQCPKKKLGDYEKLFRKKGAPKTAKYQK